MSDNYNDLFSEKPNDENKVDTNDVDNTTNDNVDTVNTNNFNGEYSFKGTGEKENIYSNSPYSQTFAQNPYTTQQNTAQNTAPNTAQNTAYNGAQYNQYNSQYGAYTAPSQNNQYGSAYTNYTANPYTAPSVPVKPKKDKKGMGVGLVALLLIISIFASSVMGFIGAMVYTNFKTTDSSTEAMVINKVDIDEETAQQTADKSTSQIADEVADTVVEITTEIMSTNSFYGQYVSQGAGSGVIISTDGYIVTNNHVIDGASSITVTLRDQTTYEAQLIGKDSVVDVALLKIDATGLKAATFGDSDNLKVGDKAVAIGNPLGQLGGTVTDGIISALDRDVVIDGETMNLLQTDTAINPGNSGGGLFDGQGALIGVVVAKSSGEEIEGLGFAIPINDVIDIVDDLKEFGYVRGRVSMGVELIDLTNTMYAMYYYGNDEAGCYVYSVVPDSAAYKAGIQKGDRIVSVDGKTITTTADVEAALDNKKVGDVVKVELERGSKTATIEIKLDEYIPQDVVRSQQSENDINNPFS